MFLLLALGLGSDRDALVTASPVAGFAALLMVGTAFLLVRGTRVITLNRIKLHGDPEVARKQAEAVHFVQLSGRSPYPPEGQLSTPDGEGGELSLQEPDKRGAVSPVAQLPRKR